MKTLSGRKANYDLLRVISTIAVIAIHVSSKWVHQFSTMVGNGTSPNTLIHPFSACLYNSICRFAVPCFLMLSGAFILAHSENGEYLPFYKRSFLKIGVHIFIFSILYVLYRSIFCLFKGKRALHEFFLILTDLAKGKPMYHMWYMYMLIVLYLLVPICIRFKSSVSEQSFKRIAILFLIVATLSRWTTENVKLSWDVGQSFEYLGYFMTGYVLRGHADGKASNIKGVLLIGSGIVIEIGTAAIEYYFQIIQGIAENNLEYQIVSPYSPPIALASILIFMGFSYLNVKESRVVSRLSMLSFFIYLCHAGVLDILLKAVRLVINDNFLALYDNAVMIPIFILAVLIFSIIAAQLYNMLYNYFYSLKVSA